MPAKSIVLFLLFTLFVSISINAYRLDGFAHLSDIDEIDELEDPNLIQRLQTLLAAAATQRGNNLKEYSTLDHMKNRRLVMNRRPGLIRLK